MSHKTQNVLLVASVTVAVVALVLSLILLVWYSHHLASDRRTEQVAGCTRANQQREYINKIIGHHPSFELPPIVIPNCEEIIK